ncbi:hypothetical protein H9657_02555 [Cellulomonas sp. Sa3CUA2]|uniref:Uncharacterized protein n=1 Tax=Cellulomonas avistercoris TaxID=2762242 RepID=A0ABR8Q9S4_9CELL|nr:hypothetical protein [Cellulomonas avistercoris]MBD7917159.1 hypothetical protein [Cellulomonas avistercoris]
MPVEPTDARRRLRALEHGTTPEDALALFDAPPAVGVMDVRGDPRPYVLVLQRHAG